MSLVLCNSAKVFFSPYIFLTHSFCPTLPTLCLTLISFPPLFCSHYSCVHPFTLFQKLSQIVAISQTLLLFLPLTVPQSHKHIPSFTLTHTIYPPCPSPATPSHLQTGADPEHVVVALGVVLVRALVDQQVVAFAEHPLAVAAHEGVLRARLPTLAQHLGLATLPVPFRHLDGVLLVVVEEERERSDCYYCPWWRMLGI